MPNKKDTAPPPSEPVPRVEAPPLDLQLERFRIPIIVFVILFPVLHHFWGVWGQFGSAAIGNSGDIAHELWSADHIADAMFLTGNSVYHTNELLAPMGTTLIFQNVAVSLWALMAPFTKLLGVYFSFNLANVLLIVFGGISIFLLVRHWSESWTAGAFAAFAFELSPIFYHRIISHVSLSAMGSIAFFLWFYTRWISEEKGTKSHIAAGLAGLFMWLLFLTDFNLVIYVAFTLGVWFLIQLGQSGIQRDWNSLKSLAIKISVSAAVFLILVYVWALLSPLQEARYWNDANPHPWAGREVATDAGFLFLANPENALWGQLIPAGLSEKAPPNIEQKNYLGWFVLLLAIPGVLQLWKSRRELLALLSLLFIIPLWLSLGVELLTFGTIRNSDFIKTLLLFDNLVELPILSQSRVPARWIFVSNIALISMAAFGLLYVSQKLPKRQWRLAFFPAAILLVFIDFAHLKSPVMKYQMPAAYQTIGRAASPYDMILEVPFGFVWGSGAVEGRYAVPERMVWSVEHEYRIVPAYLSRISDRRIMHIVNQPLIKYLWLLQGSDPRLIGYQLNDPPEEIRQWGQLNGLRYIVIQKFEHTQRIVEFLSQFGYLQKVHDDAEYIVLKVN